jgi:hypothetical protein
METAYIAIGVILVIIILGGAWWLLGGASIKDGAVFADGGGTRWTYSAASNSLRASRTTGDVSGVFAADLKSIRFAPSGVVMVVTMDNGNIKLSNGDTLRKL